MKAFKDRCNSKAVVNVALGRTAVLGCALPLGVDQLLFAQTARPSSAEEPTPAIDGLRDLRPLWPISEPSSLTIRSQVTEGANV